MSYARFADARARDEQETRLRDGTAPVWERIRAAWDCYGRGREWPENLGHVFRVQERAYLQVSSRPIPAPDHAVKFVTFDFQREVTRNKGFTVTRIHCGGLTVEERVEPSAN